MLKLDDPDEVLAYLSEPIHAVYDGLDHGLSLAASKLADVPHDPWMYAHWVRFGARLYLEEITSTDWRLRRELPNSGIEIARGPIIFRVFKSREGEPPHPGPSEARRGYWQQEQLRLPLIVDGVEFPNAANLIIDWDVGIDEEIKLALSKPSGIWHYRGQPKLEWRRRIFFESGQDLRFVPADEDISVQPKLEIEELNGEGSIG